MGYRSPVVTIGPTLTPIVKYLLIANVLVYFWSSLAGPDVIAILGLTPAAFLGKLFLWQVVTYLFLHGNFLHIFFNMLVLWMFGCELEKYLGSRRFLNFYLITGVGAGLLSVLLSPYSRIPIIGASGAIYGILMAYGMLFPERYVYLYFLFPVKVKYFVAFLGVMAFLSSLSASGGGIAHTAHLGGMIFAFLYLKGWLSISRIRQAYFRWRMQRLRKRFKVYDGERSSRKDDYWIN